MIKTEEQFKKYLINFIEDEYPKQKPDLRHIKRGVAIIVLALFMVYLIKQKILK